MPITFEQAEREYLEPPDEPDYFECEKCGEQFEFKLAKEHKGFNYCICCHDVINCEEQEEDEDET